MLDVRGRGGERRVEEDVLLTEMKRFLLGGLKNEKKELG
jgi:hypothetical protein